MAAAFLGLAAIALLGVYLLVHSDNADSAAAERRPSEAPATQDPRGPTTTARSRSPQPQRDESYVAIRVLNSGEIDVRQRVRPIAPLRKLRLTSPTGAAELSATGLRVVADGRRIDGPRRLASGSARYVFAPTTDLAISYRLVGAVERSNSADGRALALATSLNVHYAPMAARETRVISASEVLALACARSLGEAASPCGEAMGRDRWLVELDGQQVNQQVMAQLNLW